VNTKDNKRRRESRERIEKVFIELLQTFELDKVSVSDICKKAELNRTTFYANYTDIYELADSVRAKLEAQTVEFNRSGTESYNRHDYLQLFRHIYENQLFYKTYFKLGYDNQYQIIGYDTELAQKEFHDRFIDYHCEFFRSGLTAIIKLWLNGGCKETPEELFEVITSEYKGRTQI
jgi:AcrR family transcriptional regulator